MHIDLLNDKLPPIIAKLSFYTNKELIPFNARILAEAVRLRNFTDFPQEIVDIRLTVLVKVLKEEMKEGRDAKVGNLSTTLFCDCDGDRKSLFVPVGVLELSVKSPSFRANVRTFILALSLGRENFSFTSSSQSCCNI